MAKDYYTKEEVQKLIDICFQCVLVATDDECYKIKNAKSNKVKAEWVARQLRGCDFDTEPMGSSWGVLK